MNTSFDTSARVRIAAFAGAVLASAIVLGATVAGMQPADEFNGQFVALERAVITAASSATTSH